MGNLAGPFMQLLVAAYGRAGLPGLVGAIAGGMGGFKLISIATSGEFNPASLEQNNWTALIGIVSVAGIVVACGAVGFFIGYGVTELWRRARGEVD